MNCVKCSTVLRLLPNNDLICPKCHPELDPWGMTNETR